MHRQAMLYGDYVEAPGGKMAFEWGLANADGAWFRLLAEPHHTKEDVAYAKAAIKRTRDVVGRIQVFHLRLQPWADDPLYPVSDWQDEVANGDTRLGYIEWVEHRRESDAQ